MTSFEVAGGGVRQEGFEFLFESGGSEAGDQLQCRRSELIAPVGAIDGALGLIGIFEKQAVLDELVDCLTADGLAGVWCVADFVLVAHPVHHLGDPAEWSGGAFPGSARFDVGEGEKCEGRAFVLLFPRNADHLEQLKRLADSCG